MIARRKSAMRNINSLALALFAAIDPPYEGPVRGSALVSNSLTLGDGSELLGTLSMGDVDLIDDLADVGAMPARFNPRQMQGRRIPRPAIMPGRALPARRLIPQVPGAPSVGLRLQPLGFPAQVFGSTSGTALTAVTRPQRPFKPKRLVIDLARTGTTATGLVLVTQASIGTNNQFVATQPIGAGAFAPGAYDTNIEFAACSTALDVSVGYSITTAPTTTDTVAIATTMFGESVG